MPPKEYEEGCSFCHGEHIVSKDGDYEVWLDRDIEGIPYLKSKIKLYAGKPDLPSSMASYALFTSYPVYKQDCTLQLTVHNCPQCGRKLD